MQRNIQTAYGLQLSPPPSVIPMFLLDPKLRQEAKMEFGKSQYMVHS